MRLSSTSPGRRLVAHKNVTINEDFFQGHFPGVPLMPGVLMLETLTQVAAALRARARRADADVARLPARRRRREVSTAGRAGRSAAPRGDARRARTSLAKARGVAFVGDQIVAEADLLLAVDARRRAHSSDGRRHDRRRDRRRHDRRRQRGRRRARQARQPLPHRRIGRGRRVHRDWRRDRDLSVRVDRAHPAGPEVQGRRDLPEDRRAEHLSRVRHHPPRHAGRRRKDDDRRPQRVHGLRARGARLPHRQRHDLRQQRDARRPRVRRRLRHDQRRLRRAPVLPRSGATRSSAAIRLSRRMRCRMRRPSATARASTG